MLKYSLINCILFALIFKACCSELKPITDNKIANILLKSRSLIADSPNHSMECFSIYIPKLNELTMNYEAEYENCLKRTTEDRNIVDLEVQRDRRDLEESSAQVCGKFQSCSTNYKSALEFFECYGNAVCKVHNIQNVAKEKTEYIKIRYETIEYNHNRCTDKCSRTYVEESSKIYDDLDKCLAFQNF
ncbi:uncharacterized protein LOC135961277 [Calliphora vicina]|uniref:uncharacterized protein LOC135961277 n=1 Tax=Calliphora vicina TaxID=7373 RepID=UPI00325AA2CE